MPDAIPGDKLRIFLVDDHPIVRHGISQLINAEPDMQVVGEASNYDEAIAFCSANHVDIALVDVSLPGLSGIDLVRELSVLCPGLRSIVVSMGDENVNAERALRAGAKGYIMKDAAPRQIVAAVRDVRNGGMYLSESMKAVFTAQFADGKPVQGRRPIDLLSATEYSIFRLIGQGYERAEIAKKLNRSVNTIEAHRAHIKKKLHIKSSTELLRIACQDAAVGSGPQTEPQIKPRPPAELPSTPALDRWLRPRRR